MLEIDVRIQASVTGADAGELDSWWLDVGIARLSIPLRLPTLDALASWRQQHGWWGAFV